MTVVMESIVKFVVLLQVTECIVQCFTLRVLLISGTIFPTFPRFPWFIRICFLYRIYFRLSLFLSFFILSTLQWRKILFCEFWGFWRVLCVCRCAICVSLRHMCVCRCAICVCRCAICVCRCAICVCRCAICVCRCAICVCRCAMCLCHCAISEKKGILSFEPNSLNIYSRTMKYFSLTWWLAVLPDVQTEI